MVNLLLRELFKNIPEMAQYPSHSLTRSDFDKFLKSSLNLAGYTCQSNYIASCMEELARNDLIDDPHLIEYVIDHCIFSLNPRFGLAAHLAKEKLHDRERAETLLRAAKAFASEFKHRMSLTYSSHRDLADSIIDYPSTLLSRP